MVGARRLPFPATAEEEEDVEEEDEDAAAGATCVDLRLRAAEVGVPLLAAVFRAVVRLEASSVNSCCFRCVWVRTYNCGFGRC